MSDKHAAVLRAHEANEALIDQLKTVRGRIESLRTQAADARGKHDAACKEVERLTAMNIRGLVSDSDLSEQRATVFSLAYEANETAEKADHAAQVLANVNAELAAVSIAARQALQEVCGEVDAAISRELATDRRLRGKLLELYAAVAATRPHHLQSLANPRWLAILEAAFPEPTSEEAARAVADFETKHKLPAWSC